MSTSCQQIFEETLPFKCHRVADSEKMEIEHMTLQSEPFKFIQPAHSSDSSSNQAIIEEWGNENQPPMNHVILVSLKVFNFIFSDF